jgi:hypothetical protein
MGHRGHGAWGHVRLRLPVPAIQAAGQAEGTPTAARCAMSQPRSPAPILAAAQAEPPRKPSQMCDTVASLDVCHGRALNWTIGLTREAVSSLAERY